MEESSKKNRQVAKISVFIASIFVIFISISYAFINQTLTGTKKQVVTAGNLELELKEGEIITLENALPMYDEVGMIGKPFEFTLRNKTAQNADYVLKLKNLTEGTNKLDTSIVKYGLTKDESTTKDLLSNLTDNVIDTGTLTENQTVSYSLRLWIDSSVEDEAQIKGKSLSYKIEVDATLGASVAKSIVFDTIAENLGENCKTYDDGTDTFLVGQCSKNYVWYSGKLWRVVLKNNETGAVKMVTDNAIATITYNVYGQVDFENSYMDQWLNQEFLPTLHDYQDYLVVDSTWDATLDNSTTPSRPAGTTQVSRTVGLLNAYEYYTTYNNSDNLATSNTVYLNNSVDWHLMTPYDARNVRYVNDSGYSHWHTTTNGGGGRPSVNLQNGIRITSGSGTKSEPYKLEEDSGKINNGTTLLSTRYSGEYVTFNNELYRIVTTENNLTKITAVDKPDTLSSNYFHSANAAITFANASIKTDLENYYQNNVVEPYKSMIAPNTAWYLGAVGSEVNYKASICKTVNQEVSTSACERTDALTTSNVGLPRVGEMFTSQITRGTKAFFWILTPYSTSGGVWCVRAAGNLYSTGPGNSFGVRPSIYLKSNVVIASTNAGDGTYEHPYDIELSE